MNTSSIFNVDIDIDEEFSVDNDNIVVLDNNIFPSDFVESDKLSIFTSNIDNLTNETNLSPSYTSKRNRSIMQCDPITQQVLYVYSSMSLAARLMNISAHTISNCCNNKQRLANGFIWKFYEGPKINWKVATGDFLSFEELQQLQSNIDHTSTSEALITIDKGMQSVDIDIDEEVDENYDNNKNNEKIVSVKNNENNRIEDDIRYSVYNGSNDNDNFDQQNNYFFSLGEEDSHDSLYIQEKENVDSQSNQEKENVDSQSNKEYHSSVSKDKENDVSQLNQEYESSLINEIEINDSQSNQEYKNSVNNVVINFSNNSDETIPKTNHRGNIAEQCHPITGDVLRIYRSMNAAAKYMNVLYNKIFACCYKKQGTAGGFVWRFYEGSDIDWTEESRKFLSYEELRFIQKEITADLFIDINKLDSSLQLTETICPIEPHLDNIDVNESLYNKKTSLEHSTAKMKNRITAQCHPLTQQILRLYPNMNAAAKFMNMNNGSISLCCNNKQKLANGFIWKYYSGPDIDWAEASKTFLSLKELRKIRENPKKYLSFRLINLSNDTEIRSNEYQKTELKNLQPEDKHYEENVNLNNISNSSTKESRSKAVAQCHPITEEVLRVYPSMLAAAKFMNINSGSISHSCNQRQKVVYGFIWKYYTGPAIIDWGEACKNYRSLQELKNIRKNFKNMETSDVNEANYDIQNKTANNMKMKYNNDFQLSKEYEPQSFEYDNSDNLNKIVKDINNRKAKIVVQCHPITQEVLRLYPSINAACKFMKINASRVSDCCYNKISVAYGFIWKFYDGQPFDWTQASEKFLSLGELNEIQKNFIVEFKSNKKLIDDTTSVNTEIMASQHDSSNIADNVKDSTNISISSKVETRTKIVAQCHPITKQILRLYPNMNEAAKFMNMNTGSISVCCNKKQKIAKGFIWKFHGNRKVDWTEASKTFLSYEDLQKIQNNSSNDEMSLDKSKSQIDNFFVFEQTANQQDIIGSSVSTNNDGYKVSTSLHLKPKRRLVQQCHPITEQILRIYPSGSAAAKFMNINGASISACCHNKIKMTNGFIWKFYDGPPIDWTEASNKFLSYEELQKIKKNLSEDGSPIMNKSISNNTDTSIDNIQNTNQSQSVNLQTSDSTEISTVGLSNKSSETSILKWKKRIVRQCHPITKQTLRIYPSVSEAAKFMNASASNISSCCSNKVKTAVGFIWRFHEEQTIDWMEASKTFLSLEELQEIQINPYNNELSLVEKSIIDPSLTSNQSLSSKELQEIQTNIYSNELRVIEKTNDIIEPNVSDNQNLSQLEGLETSESSQPAVIEIGEKPSKQRKVKAKRRQIEQCHPSTQQVLRIYPSISAAARFMNINAESISACCHNKTKMTNGFVWRFSEGPSIDCTEVSNKFLPFDELINIQNNVESSIINKSNSDIDSGKNFNTTASIESEKIINLNDIVNNYVELTLEHDLNEKIVEQCHPVTQQVLRIYPCIEAASKFMKVQSSSILENCHDKIKVANNFIWKFYEGSSAVDWTEASEKFLSFEELQNIQNDLSNNSSIVENTLHENSINTIEQIDISHLKKQTNSSNDDNINAIEQTNTRRHNKLVKDKSSLFSNLSSRSTSRIVEQCHPITNEVLRIFPSVVAAAKLLNMNISSIRSCCNNKRKIYYGFIWRYYEGPPINWKDNSKVFFSQDELQLMQASTASIIPSTTVDHISISNTDDDNSIKVIEQCHPISRKILRIYPSISAAAKFMNMPFSEVSEGCNTPNKITNGFIFRYYNGPIIDWTEVSKNFLTRKALKKIQSENMLSGTMESPNQSNLVDTVMTYDEDLLTEPNNEKSINNKDAVTLTVNEDVSNLDINMDTVVTETVNELKSVNDKDKETAVNENNCVNNEIGINYNKDDIHDIDVMDNNSSNHNITAIVNENTSLSNYPRTINTLNENINNSNKISKVTKSLKRKVEQCNPTNKEVVRSYSSIAEASKSLGFSYKSISKWCLDKKMSRGYFWRFSDATNQEPNDNQINVTSETTNLSNVQNISEKTVTTNLSNVQNISQKIVISNVQSDKAALNYQEEYERINSMLISKAIEQIHPITKNVVRIYPSIKAAANHLHLDNMSILNCCIKQSLSFNGYIWKFYEGPEIYWAVPEDNLNPAKKQNTKKTTTKESVNNTSNITTTTAVNSTTNPSILYDFILTKSSISSDIGISSSSLPDTSVSSSQTQTAQEISDVSINLTSSNESDYYHTINKKLKRPIQSISTDENQIDIISNPIIDSNNSSFRNNILQSNKMSE